MMVVAFLRQPNFILKPEYLRSIFTHRAVHVVASLKDFAHPIRKGGDDLGMIVEIARFDKFDIRMGSCHLVDESVDAVNQIPERE